MTIEEDPHPRPLSKLAKKRGNFGEGCLSIFDWIVHIFRLKKAPLLQTRALTSLEKGPGDEDFKLSYPISLEQMILTASAKYDSRIAAIILLMASVPHQSVHSGETTMKFGVCGGPDLARIAKAAGYDYFEWSVGGLLHPREEESVFTEALRQAQAVGLPCPAVNVFIPADLKITGLEVDRAALEGFVTTALRRASQTGVELIGFGSGGARAIPVGFDPQRAWQQLVEFGRMAGQLGEQFGVTVAVEPLNKAECNVLTTLDESASLVREVDLPRFRLLADGYHWAKDGDSRSGILDNADLLVHAHVATVEGRRPPHPGDDCAPFFAALKQAGYTGRVSIEGNIQTPETELPLALATMRALAG